MSGIEQQKQPSEDVQSAIDLVQSDIAYCTNCQPWDNGPVWVLGDKIYLKDLLDEYEITDEIQEEVAENLHCMNCGSEQELWNDVGRESSYEIEADDIRDQWYKSHAPKLKELVEWLQEFPLLGSTHPVGEEIVNEMKTAKSCNYTKIDFWRARPCFSPKKPNCIDLGPPKKPPSSEGRFSHHGQIVFYLGGYKETAVSEVLASDEELAWIQKFRIPKNLKLLDLRPEYGHQDEWLNDDPMLFMGIRHSRAHLESLRAPESEWKPEYILPRFIADAARSCSFDGILYTSTKHIGDNLVIWGGAMGDVEPVGVPELFDKDSIEKLDF